MDESIKDKWRRFLNNEANEKEIEDVLGYIGKEGSAPDTDELNTLWEQLHSYPKLRQDHADQIYREIERRQEHLRQDDTRIRRQPFRLPQWARMAASIVLLVGAGLSAYLLWDSRVVFTETVSGYERRTVTLADGSEIVLNLHSKLRYPQKFRKDKREVFLEGEAFFSVTKDDRKPFIVRSGAIETRVLGTSFDISARGENRYEVAVATGKVKVTDLTTDGAGELAVLTPGQTLSYSAADGQAVVKEDTPGEVARWKDRTILFDNESMDKVLKVLGRRYGVKFTLENKKIGNCRVSMKIENESLQTVMEDIRVISNQSIGYQIKDKTIIVTGKGCANDNN
ncbi:MAG: hypothetical protein ABS46_20685 [Cytophagaceae bacterium SCN 52-12]|nr:MAG: hypothetical protein ABS46_20685 [Cytophagaceae bacterium SCN 52-12]